MASIFSEEFSERAELRKLRELEREKRGLELGDARSLRKYDRLKKKNKLKVKLHEFGVGVVVADLPSLTHTLGVILTHCRPISCHKICILWSLTRS